MEVKLQEGQLVVSTEVGVRPASVEQVKEISRKLVDGTGRPAVVLISSRGYRYKAGRLEGKQVVMFESALVAIGEAPSRSKVTAAKAAVAAKSVRRRRCPRCGSVLRAGELACLTLGPNWGRGEAIRQCPICGAQAPTKSFVLVRA